MDSILALQVLEQVQQPATKQLSSLLSVVCC